MADLIHFVDDIDVEEIVNILEDNEDIQDYFDDDMNEVGNLQRIMNITSIFVHFLVSGRTDSPDGLINENTIMAG